MYRKRQSPHTFKLLTALVQHSRLQDEKFLKKLTYFPPKAPQNYLGTTPTLRIQGEPLPTITRRPCIFFYWNAMTPGVSRISNTANLFYIRYFHGWWKKHLTKPSATERADLHKVPACSFTSVLVLASLAMLSIFAWRAVLICNTGLFTCSYYGK